MESGIGILTYFTILLARAIIYIQHVTYFYIYKHNLPVSNLSNYSGCTDHSRFYARAENELHAFCRI